MRNTVSGSGTVLLPADPPPPVPEPCAEKSMGEKDSAFNENKCERFPSVGSTAQATNSALEKAEKSGTASGSAILDKPPAPPKTSEKAV